jgi:two-component system, OmpR family, phosphate regulon sensor histidine kinase PhoR
MESVQNDLERFIERLPLGVIVLNSDMQIRICNDLSMSLLDVGVENLLNADFMDIIKDFNALKDSIRQVHSGKAQQHHAVLTVGEKSLSCTVLATVDPPGGDELMVLVEDATSLGKIEQMKREFIGTLLHKIRSPLATIKTTLSMLQDGPADLGPKCSVETKEILGMCYEEVNRLSLLINDMRDLFVIETKLAEKELEMEDFTVGSALTRAVADLGKSLSLKTVNTRISFAGDPGLFVRADFDKTKKVFIVLLKNALQYSAPDTPVKVVCTRVPGYVNIQVKDSGVGITEKMMDFVFSKYFREDNPATRNSAGNGLGLFIARSYIELMKGSIYFESRQGAGTSFNVTLPVIERP